MYRACSVLDVSSTVSPVLFVRSAMQKHKIDPKTNESNRVNEKKKKKERKGKTMQQLPNRAKDDETLSCIVPA